MNTARSVALEALLQVETNEGYSNIVIDKALKSGGLDARDSALATQLFYGVLEKRLRLDYAIARFSKLPLAKLDAQVLEILRIAVYQILFLEKIPKSAAVNEAVNLAKAGKAVKASGFINGILRSLLRSEPKTLLPDAEKDSLHYQSVFYSCPEWLISLWISSYGEVCLAGLLESTLVRAPVFLRVNTQKISVEKFLQLLEEHDVKADYITGIPGAVRLENAGSVAALPGFEEGLFHVQDLSSQICCLLAKPKPGSRVIDVCSAPGGKAFTLAEWMEDRGALLAFDKYKGKVGLIRSGAQRLGLSCIQASVRDALEGKEPLEPADTVLCDAPCSGLGILRRKPEIRYKDQASLDSLPDLQYRILYQSSQLCRPGGKLFYSTCTLNPAENGEVAGRFLQENKEFEPLPLELPDGLLRGIPEPEHQCTLFPHLHQTDGFFLSAFRRRET